MSKNVLEGGGGISLKVLIQHSSSETVVFLYKRGGKRERSAVENGIGVKDVSLIKRFAFGKEFTDTFKYVIES